MPLNFEIQNQKIRDWMQATEKDIQSTGAGMGVSHRSGSPSNTASLPKVKGRQVLDSGTTRAVAFRFPRSLIYPHTGSGRGQGGAKGSRWITKEGIRKRTNPASLNKLDAGNRKAKPFLNEALTRQVPALADIVAETSADIITVNLFKQ
jgi:hypothetical protein